MNSQGDNNIKLNFYENSGLLRFNTTIVEMNFYKNSTEFQQNSPAVLKSDSNYLSDFRLMLICDKNYPGEPWIELFEIENESPKYIVYFHHEKCCVNFSIEGFWKFVNNYYIIFGVFLLCFGLVLAFIGAKILKMVLIFAVGVFSMSILAPFVYTYLMPTPIEDWMNWLALGIIVSIGVGLGYLSLKIMKAGIFLAGAMGGAIPGLMLYQAVIYMIKPDSQVTSFYNVKIGAIVYYSFYYCMRRWLFCAMVY